jgi:acetyltransferase-like isoleucine patch superfamily enzyme
MHLMYWSGCAVAHRSSVIWAGASFGSKNFTIEEGVLINKNFYFDGSDRLTIGKNTQIGAFVRVITGSHEIDANPLYRCGPHVTAPVSIGEGCWIGSGTTILPGVTVARGCVIGAGSIVAKSTEPDGLYFGIPARWIRDLPY